MQGRDDPVHDQRLRRMALQIAAQLPEDIDDAEFVLVLASELLTKFFRDPLDAVERLEHCQTAVILPLKDGA